MIARRPLLVSSDTELIEDVMRLAAANGVEVHLAHDADAARGQWALAPLVLVGADVSSLLVTARLARRRDVVIVGGEPTEQGWRDAVALGAEHVVHLPEADRWLIDRLADCGEGPARDGRVIAVMGAGGGSGASTFAATLALAASSRSMRTLLVDADPLAGGLDILLGMEDTPGIRWPDLVETRGRLGAAALDPALPHSSGVSVLSWGRAGPHMAPVEAMSTVLDAGVRGYDLVVADLPRHLDATTELVLSRSDETVLVVSNHVRATAGAARIAAVLTTRSASVGVVLRNEPKALSEDAVVSALGLPVLARLPHLARLPTKADEGEPPGLRDSYGRSVLEALGLMRAPWSEGR